jgi:excisionase family DNA binding protein
MKGSHMTDNYYTPPQRDLTLPQFCKELQISQNTAYLMLKKGSLTGYKLGKQWRITPDSIKKLKGGN